MPKTEIRKISTVIKCNNHITRITINFNLILQLESLLCVNATRMRSSVLWPGSAPITVERYCHQNNPKMPPLITEEDVDMGRRWRAWRRVRGSGDGRGPEWKMRSGGAGNGKLRGVCGGRGTWTWDGGSGHGGTWGSGSCGGGVWGWRMRTGSAGNRTHGAAPWGRGTLTWDSGGVRGGAWWSGSGGSGALAGRGGVSGSGSVAG